MNYIFKHKHFLDNICRHCQQKYFDNDFLIAKSTQLCSEFSVCSISFLSLFKNNNEDSITIEL